MGDVTERVLIFQTRYSVSQLHHQETAMSKLSTPLNRVAINHILNQELSWSLETETPMTIMIITITLIVTPMMTVLKKLIKLMMWLSLKPTQHQDCLEITRLFATLQIGL